MTTSAKQQRRWQRNWDKQSKHYDKHMTALDRMLFRDTRSWVCGQARGETLEVAVGTGLNLAHYPPDVHVTGIELSSAMLAHAVARAQTQPANVTLQRGDAHHLDFAADTFDTVVCTFSLCAIPDHEAAISEMHRVLRPGGALLLADHVEASPVVLRGLQRLLELVSVPLAGEHFLRHPSVHLEAVGFDIVDKERFGAGLIERLRAIKRGGEPEDDLPSSRDT